MVNTIGGRPGSLQHLSGSKIALMPTRCGAKLPQLLLHLHLRRRVQLFFQSLQRKENGAVLRESRHQNSCTLPKLLAITLFDLEIVDQHAVYSPNGEQLCARPSGSKEFHVQKSAGGQRRPIELCPTKLSMVTSGYWD